MTLDAIEYEPLQWSHDLSAMDTMEAYNIVTPTPALQWSHDLSAMDT